jgi:hypothetical protein
MIVSLYQGHIHRYRNVICHDSVQMRPWKSVVGRTAVCNDGQILDRALSLHNKGDIAGAAYLKLLLEFGVTGGG